MAEERKRSIHPLSPKKGEGQEMGTALEAHRAQFLHLEIGQPCPDNSSLIREEELNRLYQPMP